VIIDVTHVMLGDPPTHRRPGGRIARQAIRNWLEDNVGEYYSMDTVVGLSNLVGSGRAIGSGWEFGTSCESDNDGNLKIGWVVDIADEQLALMFALRFG
jgi:hypothetical protein